MPNLLPSAAARTITAATVPLSGVSSLDKIVPSFKTKSPGTQVALVGII